MKVHKICFIILSFLITSFSFAVGVNTLTTEVGVVHPSYNMVSIPGDVGTTFNMRKSLSDSSYFRLDFKRELGNKHGLRFLYAPLRLTGSRTYGKDINFNGETFQGGSETKTLYKFNSYRVTYFYQWIKEDKWRMNVGLTAKVRDAQVQLRQGNHKKNRSDLGVVPLFYIWSEYDLTKKTKMTFDFDGLAAPQGRAIDIALSIGHRIKDNLIANIGYRILEGGANNDKVYNFSQFNYLFGSVEVKF